MIGVNMIPRDVGSGRQILRRGWPLAHSYQLVIENPKEEEQSSTTVQLFGLFCDACVAVLISLLFTWLPGRVFSKLKKPDSFRGSK